MTDSPDTTTSSSNPSAKMQDALARLWLKNEPVLQERIRAIRRACELLTALRVDDHQLESHAGIDQVRIEARDAAHKLAGVLGTFGLPQGTDFAREVEVSLDHPENFNADKIGRLGWLLGELETMLAAKSKALA